MTAVKKLTSMNGDIRQIAKLLQAKAPPHHKLAFINDAEDALLRSKGAKGLPYKDTGVPNYTGAQIDVSAPDAGLSQAQASDANLPPPVTQTSAEASDANLPPPTTKLASDSTFGNLGTGTFGVPNETFTNNQFSNLQTIPGTTQAVQPAGTLGSGSFAATPPTDLTQNPLQPTPSSDVQSVLTGPQQTTYDKVKSYLSDVNPKTYAALGIGGTQALLGASAVRKAQNEAAQAKAELQSMAAPYQQQGQQLQQYALQGQLTPANQQVLDAARAQLAQGAAARGGVGNQQAANQIANLTQSLLANQMNMGIQLQGVGDKIAQGAIQTGIQADQYINQLTSSYAQNIARTVAGATGLPGQTQTTTTVTNQ
jgi:hypothetical protein